MFCRKCGKKVQDKDLFCINCGEPIIYEEAQEKIEKSDKEDVKEVLDTHIDTDEFQTNETAIEIDFSDGVAEKIQQTPFKKSFNNIKKVAKMLYSVVLGLVVTFVILFATETLDVNIFGSAWSVVFIFAVVCSLCQFLFLLSFQIFDIVQKSYYRKQLKSMNVNYASVLQYYSEFTNGQHKTATNLGNDDINITLALLEKLYIPIRVFKIICIILSSIIIFPITFSFAVLIGRFLVNMLAENKIDIFGTVEFKLAIASLVIMIAEVLIESIIASTLQKRAIQRWRTGKLGIRLKASAEKAEATENKPDNKSDDKTADKTADESDKTSSNKPNENKPKDFFAMHPKCRFLYRGIVGYMVLLVAAFIFLNSIYYVFTDDTTTQITFYIAIALIAIASIANFIISFVIGGMAKKDGLTANEIYKSFIPFGITTEFPSLKWIAVRYNNKGYLALHISNTIFTGTFFISLWVILIPLWDFIVSFIKSGIRGTETVFPFEFIEQMMGAEFPMELLPIIIAGVLLTPAMIGTIVTTAVVNKKNQLCGKAKLILK